MSIVDCYVDPDLFPAQHPLHDAECIVHQRQCTECGTTVEVCLVHDEQAYVCPHCGGYVDLAESEAAWNKFSSMRLA